MSSISNTQQISHHIVAGLVVLTLGIFLSAETSRAATTITAITYNEGGPNLTIPPSALVNDDAVVLQVSDGSTTHNVVGSSSNNLGSVGDGVYFYDTTGGTDPGSASGALSDSFIPSGASNTDSVPAGSEFYFSAAPTSVDDLVVILESSGLNLPAENTTWQLIDNTSTPIGIAASPDADWGISLGTHTVSGSDTFYINAVGISMSDFGITAGTLASVAGVELTATSGADPLFVGLTQTPVPAPEPSTILLAALGFVGLMGTRRRRRN